MPPGRPPLRVCGLTAVQWATALGEPTATSLRRARAVLSGDVEPDQNEIIAVADHVGVDLGELTRALAALRGERAVVTLTASELAHIADHVGVDLGELTRALAAQ